MLVASDKPFSQACLVSGPTSTTRAWWVDCLRDFMVRTMAASMLYRRSFSTSSVTLRFSSMGGKGICSACMSR